MKSTAGKPRARSAAGLSLVLMLAAAGTALGEDVELSVRADQPGDTISRLLYGQFAEHLGRGIYGGIWVGEDSEIPNTQGFRDDVIEALKKLHIPVIRWPGGCFADEYNWRDGIGPRDQRPVRLNKLWGWVRETNAFGTHEFMNLVDILGSEAYIAGNLGSGSPRDMAEWLEYMTEDQDTTLARLRRANGRDEPWKVPFFGVGNESWGCGGSMLPPHYMDLYRRYATFLRTPEGNRPKLVASGGWDARTDWTETLASGVNEGEAWAYRLDGISHHYYTIPTGDWDKKGSATGFPEEEWISTLYRTMLVDEHLTANERVLDALDPDEKIGIYLDEWGTWYDPEEGHEPGFLYQQNSIRDALVAALNFNIFHRHTRRLHMANIAQTVNVLQAVVLTEGDRIVRTPTYHAFEMYVPFQDATFLPVEPEDMTDYELGEVSVPHVSATAALTGEGELVVALVNLHARDAVDVDVELRGYAAASASGRVRSR
ncbi:MAG: alpha-L-arabinofuranosidase C-terminal domain-containing protein [Woeseiaceae bacterium]